MAVQKVNLPDMMRTKSFDKDNYARRVMEKTAAAVDANADELSEVLKRLEPLKLWGTLTLPVGTSIAANGVMANKAAFTPVAGAPEFTKAKAIAVTVAPICGATGGYGAAGTRNLKFSATGANGKVYSRLITGNVGCWSLAYTVTNDQKTGLLKSELTNTVSSTNSTGGATSNGFDIIRYGTPAFDSETGATDPLDIEPEITDFSIVNNTNSAVVVAQLPTTIKVYIAV